MTEDEELYKEIIVDHSQTPRNHGVFENPTHQHHGHNPLCGDEVELQFSVKDGIIQKVMFQGSGCAISQASASMLTQQLVGKTTEQALEELELFREWMRARGVSECPDCLGDFQAMAGVRVYPARVKCALLAWTTFEEALES